MAGSQKQQNVTNSTLDTTLKHDYSEALLQSNQMKENTSTDQKNN